MFDWLPSVTDFLDSVLIWREVGRLMGLHHVFPNAFAPKGLRSFRQLIPEMEGLAQTFEPPLPFTGFKPPYPFGEQIKFREQHRWITLRAKLRIVDVSLSETPTYAEMIQLIELAKDDQLEKAQKMFPVNLEHDA